jgi:hypothetical protein
MSGIALCIKYSLLETLATLGLMQRVRGSFTDYRTNSSGAIISNDGSDAGSKPNCGTKTA